MDKLTKKTILVIDNDKESILKYKSTFLNTQYKVIYVQSGQEGIDYCIKNVVDLLILDLLLPDKDGLAFIEFVRSFNAKLPIIVCTSKNSTEIKVLSLDTGANDFMVKPINSLELLARIRNQFRYLYKEESHILKNGNLTIDFDAKTIYVNGVEVHFTNFEYKIVVLLAHNLDKTLEHNYIISQVWGPNGQDQNGLRVFMAGIRKKISKDEKSSHLIRTDIGIGYRMNSIK